MSRASLKINGQVHAVDVDPDTPKATRETLKQGDAAAALANAARKIEASYEFP